jgi:hypothetical protein
MALVMNGPVSDGNDDPLDRFRKISGTGDEQPEFSKLP